MTKTQNNKYTKNMTLRKLLAMSLISSCLTSPVQALTINFDFSYDDGYFTNDTERMARLDHAAGFYSSFSDRLSPIVPGANNSWNVVFNNPSNLGMQVVETDLSVAADTVRIYVGASAMGPGVLGYGTTGSIFNVTGSAQFMDDLYTRGQQNTIGPKASDFGIWGGAIIFNSDANWYWGEDISGLDNTMNDFLTTAVHEIGHVLGYGPADSWSEKVINGMYHGDASMALFGGPVPADSAHWGEGVYSFVNGVPQETMMDPSTPAGIRQLPTDLDYAGFSDIGWQVAAVPVPPAIFLLCTGFLALVAASRRRRQ